MEQVERTGDFYVVHSRSDLCRELNRRALEKGYTLRHLRQRGNDLDEITADILRKESRKMVVSIKRKIKDSFLSAGNSGNNMPDKGAQIRPCNGMGGMAALYRKEMSDHIRSKRFLIVLGLILLTSCASIYGALTGLSDAVASDSSYIFLKLFTLSGSSIPSFTSFIALLDLLWAEPGI